jgi:predicted HTH domain antitoxin
MGPDDMSENNATTLLERELAATVRAGLFRSEAQAVREVLDTFFAAKPQYRVEAALEMWKTGEVSLERAAEIAGMNFFLFRDLMIERGIKVVVEVDEKRVREQSRKIRDQYM